MRLVLSAIVLLVCASTSGAQITLSTEKLGIPEYSERLQKNYRRADREPPDGGRV